METGQKARPTGNWVRLVFVENTGKERRWVRLARQGLAGPGPGIPPTKTGGGTGEIGFVRYFRDARLGRGGTVRLRTGIIYQFQVTPSGLMSFW